MRQIQIFLANSLLILVLFSLFSPLALAQERSTTRSFLGGFGVVVMREGFGKRSPLTDYRQQKRGGSGIKTANVTSKTGEIIGAAVLQKPTVADTDLFIISEKGQVIRIAAQSVRVTGRAAQGVRLMRPGESSGKVATFTLWEE